jgi:hypothetical protein
MIMVAVAVAVAVVIIILGVRMRRGPLLKGEEKLLLLLPLLLGSASSIFDLPPLGARLKNKKNKNSACQKLSAP